MALEITYLCTDCAREIQWLYDEEENTILPEAMTGCDGQNCRRIHAIGVRELSDEDEQRLSDQLDE